MSHFPAASYFERVENLMKVENCGVNSLWSELSYVVMMAEFLVRGPSHANMYAHST